MVEGQGRSWSSSCWRPLHDGFIYVFSYLGMKLGGLSAVYGIGYVLAVSNAMLFYRLLKRLSDQPMFWWTGALVFALFRYETFFLVFFAAPLLKQISRPEDTKRARLFRHAVIMALVFVSEILLRKLLLGGMGVLGHLDICEAVAIASKQVLIGSMVGMAMLFYRPVQALFLANGPMISGRESRVHAAAVVGASILVAWAITALWWMARKRGLGRLASFCIATDLCLLVGFGWLAQADYLTSWQYQQTFWRDVVRLCPDLSAGSVVLVESHRSFKRPAQIKAQSWSLPVVLDAIVAFPADWQPVPRLYQLDKKWKQRIVSYSNDLRVDDAVEWLPFLKSAPQELYASKDVILPQVDQGKLICRSEITIQGKGTFLLKPRGDDLLLSFGRARLYERLISNGQQQPLEYLMS